MKFLKKTLSVGLSLALCASMVAPGFAASFSELQGVIDNQQSLHDVESGDVRIDYNEGNVTLHEDVTYNPETDSSTTTITVKENVTIDLNGNTIDGGYKAGESEGSKDSVITVEDGADLTIKDSSKDQSGQITGGNASLGNSIENNAGGGVYVDDGSLTLESGSITGNNAGKNGGGVYVGKDGTFTMNGGAVANNTTGNSGGGVYLNTELSAQNDGEAKFVMNGGEISGNTVGSTENKTGSGGGIGAVTYAENKDHTQAYDSIVINGGTIKNNTAGANGGGIESLNGTVKINGKDDKVVISGNTAGNYGGGIYSYDSKTEIENAVISGNKTTEDTVGRGGGIFANMGTVNIKDSEISGNEASKYGGGLFVGSNTTVTMESGALANNTAVSGDDIVVATGGKIKLPAAIAMTDKDGNLIKQCQ